MMNILFTCAGRRNYLIGFFRDALGKQGRVIATDSSQYAPALSEADEGILVPKIDAANYLASLLDICVEKKVDMLFSLNDNELPILASNKELFDAIGTLVVVSSIEIIDMAFDKMATMGFVKKIGLDYPSTYETTEEVIAALKREEVTYPLFVKPRWGTASLCIEEVFNKREMDLAWELGAKKLGRMGLRSNSGKGKGMIIQQKVDGDEYGLDIVNDLSGNYRDTFIKQKIGMRAGETDKAITKVVPELRDIGKRLGTAMKHLGNVDCDVFWNGRNGTIIDINPRFGGSYPFSAVAGAKVPEAIIAWRKGEDAPEGWNNLSNGIASSKCDRIVQCAFSKMSTLTVPLST